jgi:hypothetical protein
MYLLAVCFLIAFNVPSHAAEMSKMVWGQIAVAGLITSILRTRMNVKTTVLPSHNAARRRLMTPTESAD